MLKLANKITLGPFHASPTNQPKSKLLIKQFSRLFPLILLLTSSGQRNQGHKNAVYASLLVRGKQTMLQIRKNGQRCTRNI